MGWPFWVAVMAVLGLMAAVHVWEKRLRSVQELTEPEMLFVLARSTDTSEFDHFRLAAVDWNISKKRVEADFDRYLLQATLPHYVRDYLRKVKASKPDLLDRGTNFFIGTTLTR